MTEFTVHRVFRLYQTFYYKSMIKHYIDIVLNIYLKYLLSLIYHFFDLYLYLV